MPCSSKVVLKCPCGIRTQEVKCAASSSNLTPDRPELKCDDECLRQERNRRLASALNIDPASHTNDHVPYADITLKLYKEKPKWAETQEREFRVFCMTATEIRLQYKPMSHEQRQFLHVLAEDYGLDSRSEDNEPFRYVVVVKGPRFVSAPSKTLAQCVAIREKQAAAAAAASRAASPPPDFGKVEPFNGYLLISPRFALTVEEAMTALKKDLESQASFTFSIDFLPSDEVAIRATAHYSSFLDPTAVEQALVTLKPQLADSVGRTKLAGKIMLCHLDANSEVTRREVMGQPDASGWSAVATRAATKQPARVEEPATKPGGRRLLGLRKKKLEAEKETGKAWAALGSDVEC